MKGGKNRKAQSHADPDKVVLPPYYPGHPELRQDWAKYLDSWVETDKEVGRILDDLKILRKQDVWTRLRSSSGPTTVSATCAASSSSMKRAFASP